MTSAKSYRNLCATCWLHRRGPGLCEPVSLSFGEGVASLSKRRGDSRHVVRPHREFWGADSHGKGNPTSPEEFQTGRMDVRWMHSGIRFTHHPCLDAYLVSGRRTSAMSGTVDALGSPPGRLSVSHPATCIRGTTLISKPRRCFVFTASSARSQAPDAVLTDELR